MLYIDIVELVNVNKDSLKSVQQIFIFAEWAYWLFIRIQLVIADFSSFIYISPEKEIIQHGTLTESRIVLVTLIRPGL